MAEPGGGRQDPRVDSEPRAKGRGGSRREWVLRAATGSQAMLVPAEVIETGPRLGRGERVRVVEASSVPVVGAPRDEEIAEAVRLDPDRVRDVLDARDDQNDEEYALAEARGFTDVDRVVVATLVARLPHVMTVDADDCAGAILAALEPRDDRSESSSAVSSSGVAPKGEQEEVDESSASWQNGYEVGFEHAKVASPPPDRLTPRQIKRLHEIMVSFGPLTKNFDVALRDRLARLADREPE